MCGEWRKYIYLDIQPCSAMQLRKMQLQGNFVFILRKSIVERESETKDELVAGVFSASEMVVAVEHICIQQNRTYSTAYNNFLIFDVTS